MPIQVLTTDQISAQNGVKCMVYGPSGVGKTRLCATAPNPIIISAEKGLLSLRKYKTAAIEITSVDELNEAYRFCTQSKEGGNYWTVCLDSISEIGEVVLAHLMKTVGAKDPRKAYGDLIPVMSGIIRSFRDIPQKHVCVTAKMEQNKDESTGALMFGPSMPGNKVGPQIPYFFDEVFTIRMGKTPEGQLFRYLQTGPDLQYHGKDRSGELQHMEPPDLSAVFSKILSQ
jgi:hypothetical protein